MQSTQTQQLFAKHFTLIENNYKTTAGCLKVLFLTWPNNTCALNIS